MVKVSCELLIVWLFVVVLPSIYSLLLPILSVTDPFGTGAFAGELNDDRNSLSNMLETPSANGGFAAFTSPVITYVWINPITRLYPSWILLSGCFLFTLGWFLTILFPLGFATHAVHGVAFFIGNLGSAITALGLSLRLRICSIWTLFCILILLQVITVSMYQFQTFTFLVFEYLTAFVVISFVPICVTLHKPAPKITK